MENKLRFCYHTYIFLSYVYLYISRICVFLTNNSRSNGRSIAISNSAVGKYVRPEYLGNFAFGVVKNAKVVLTH